MSTTKAFDGRRLKGMLAVAEIRQNDFAKRLGVSSQTVSYWTTGVSTPPTKRLMMIATILRCSVDDLTSDIQTSDTGG